MQHSDRHNQHKACLAPFRQALYNLDPDALTASLTQLLSPEAEVHYGEPLGDCPPSELVERVYAPLIQAIPDLERRDFIVIAGQTPEGQHWVGCGGHYTGTFSRPWLDIPATGHIVSFRFHEFYRFEQNRVTEIQALWDIPELMQQARAWPLAPSLGREWQAPSPATQDGLCLSALDEAHNQQSLEHVLSMLEHLQRHPTQGGPEVMALSRFWHPHFNWYGPSGIGTARGVAGFRRWHQIPFLNAMPDRGLHPENTQAHFFAERDYVAVTGWPNMCQTLSHGGWLGIGPSNKMITLRSLDFWRLENQLIRENWVLVDLLDAYQQLGIDPLARMREFNQAKPGFCPDTGRALPHT